MDFFADMTDEEFQNFNPLAVSHYLKTKEKLFDPGSLEDAMVKRIQEKRIEGLLLNKNFFDKESDY